MSEQPDQRVNPWKEKAKAKLQPCPDCGHQISKKAATCPQCGRRITFAQAMFSAIFWAAVVLFVLGSFVLGLLQVINMH